MAARLRSLLTPGEAAGLLHVPPARLTRWSRDFEIPHIRMPNGEILFDEDDLLAWIEDLKQFKKDDGRHMEK